MLKQNLILKVRLAVNSTINAAKKTVTKVSDKVANTVKKAASNVSSAAKKTANAVKEATKDVKAIDVVQTALDVAGLIPGFGEIADGVNAAIYLARGDYANAALSAASCIPFAGMASTGAKFAGKASKAANKLGDVASVAKKTMSTLKKGAGEVAEGVAGALYTTAKTAKKTAVNVASKVQKTVKNVSSAVSSAAKSVSKNIAAGAKKTLSSVKKGAGEAAAKVAGAMTSTVNSAKKTATKVATKVQSTVSSVKKSISDGWNKLKSAFGSKGSAKNADVKTNGATDAAKSSTKADTLTQNRMQGKAYEQQEFAKFSSQNSNAVEQITIKTESGVKTRVDAIGIDSNGNVVINEFKSSATAPLTNNQKIAFPEIMESGGVVVGQGKGIFKGGYRIPAGTSVKVIRPQ